MRAALATFSCGAFLAAVLCGPALGQTVEPASQPDMAMPTDLGAPLDIAPPEKASYPVRSLTVTMPVGLIAATPKGRAALDRDLPGLCERPEFMMFKGMSPAKLASLSHGRITTADLDRLQEDLMRVGPAGAPERSYSIFTRGSRAVGRASRAIYHRVAMVIASL